jgi:capsular exopolysaccharide synthesis family protein
METFATQLVSLSNPASYAAEQYQNLRLKIERLRQTRDLRVIAITSPGANEGKTITSINLAGALARGQASRVLLIDADLRRPQVGGHLHLVDGASGFADLVAGGKVSLQDAIRPLEGFNVDVMPAGTVTGPIHDIFRSARLPQLLSHVRNRYDYVILDTPPLVPVVDSALLSRVVDGVLVVVSANRTRRKLLEQALNEIDAAKVLGIVFNNDDRPLFGYDHNYRRYFVRKH